MANTFTIPPPTGTGINFFGFDPDALLKELATGEGNGGNTGMGTDSFKTPRAPWEIERAGLPLSKDAGRTAMQENPGVLCRKPGPAFENPGRHQDLLQFGELDDYVSFGGKDKSHLPK